MVMQMTEHGFSVRYIRGGESGHRWKGRVSLHGTAGRLVQGWGNDARLVMYYPICLRSEPLEKCCAAQTEFRIPCQTEEVSTLREGRTLGMDKLHRALGVLPGASDEEIRAAFRRVAKELHPDLHPGDGVAERRFRDVLSAYETWKIAPSRMAYDASRALRRRRFRAQATTTLTVFALTVSVGLFWGEMFGALIPTHEAPPTGSGASVVVTKSGKSEQSPAFAPTPDHSSPSELVAGPPQQVPTTETPEPQPEASPDPDDKGQGFELDVPSETARVRAVLLLPRERPDSAGPSASATEKIDASQRSVPPAALSKGRDWASYRNASLGFALEYPGDVFVSDRTRPNDRESSSFQSRDGRARLIIAAAPNTSGATLSTHRRSLMEGPYKDAAFDYAPQRRTWFVLSGTLGTEIFYERITFSCDGRAFHGWKLVYPVSERTFYDRLVEEVHLRYRHGTHPGRRCR